MRKLYARELKWLNHGHPDKWRSRNCLLISLNHGFLGGASGKESICNAGDSGLIPGSGRSPGGRNGYPLQYSCLENSMDREGWRSTESQSQTWLSTHHSLNGVHAFIQNKKQTTLFFFNRPMIFFRRLHVFKWPVSIGKVLNIKSHQGKHIKTKWSTTRTTIHSHQND